jgi:hypothetical protein
MLPPDRVDMLKAELHLRDDPSMFWMSMDHPNIFLAVHKVQSPVGSYHDLAFVIQKHLTPDQPDKIQCCLCAANRNEANEDCNKQNVSKTTH